MTRSEFNKYMHENARFYSHSLSDRKHRKKMKTLSNKKKIVDDEDLNMDMESSGDKDQVLATTYPPPLTSEAPDLNDTTIIFDQEPDE